MTTIRLILSSSRGLTVLMPQPVSINSESEYDSVGLSSERSVRATPFYIRPPLIVTAQSPIIFAPTLGCRSRSRFPELDLGLTTSDSPQVGAEAEAPKEGRTKYSRLFKLRFYLSVRLCLSSRFYSYWSDHDFYTITADESSC